MKKFLAILSVSLIFMSCADLYEIEETIYLIEKGKHESRIENSLNPKGLRTLKSDRLDITVRFDESVRYNLGNSNQADINKLFGFADCNSLHHENSARFGWNYNASADRVDIFTYIYQNSTRIYEKIGSMGIGDAADLSISLQGDNYLFQFESKSILVQRGTQCDMGVYYLLYPYFGGDETAPQDIRVYIREHVQ